MKSAVFKWPGFEASCLSNSQPRKRGAPERRVYAAVLTAGHINYHWSRVEPYAGAERPEAEEEVGLDRVARAVEASIFAPLPSTVAALQVT